VNLILLIGYAVVFTVAAFMLFVRLERSGRSVTTVLILLWLLVIESALYENPNLVPNGLFHPGIGADPKPDDEIIDYAISFRLIDLVVPIAIGARLYARGLPERMRGASVWLLAFLVWLVGAALIGLYNGNSTSLIAFEAKAIVYLGVAALAASVPARDYVEGNGLFNLIYGSAVIAAALVLTDGLDESFSLDIPLLPLPDVGSIGADAASVFVALGILALALAAFRPDRRLPLFAAAGPLLTAPALAGQRAAILGLGVSLVVLLLGLVGTTRRVIATPTEFALLAVLGLGLAILPPSVAMATGSPNAHLPFAGTVEKTFHSTGKEQSAESRVNQWRKAEKLIEQRPVTGWGLGKTYTHYDPGHREFFTTDFTHNIIGDLLLRTGAIGVALFSIAMLLAVWDGWGAWRRQHDDLAAALALACLAIIAGLLARGMVESLFEKFRLATLLGITLGIIGSVAVSPVRARQRERQRLLEPEPEQAWNSGISSAH
jgi:O-antigen ligase